MYAHAGLKCNHSIPTVLPCSWDCYTVTAAPTSPKVSTINTNLVVFNFSKPNRCKSKQLRVCWTFKLCTKPSGLRSDVKPAEGLTLLCASKCESGKVRWSEKLNWDATMLRMKKLKTKIEKNRSIFMTDFSFKKCDKSDVKYSWYELPLLFSRRSRNQRQTYS